MNSPNIKKNENKKTNTSWNKVGNWYNSAVGEEGHYYHQAVILPELNKMIRHGSVKDPAILDLACGQGILGRQIPENVEYCGFDLAPSLINAARQYDKSPHHRYIVADVAKPLKLEKKDFSHAAIILALQNIEHPLQVVLNAAKHLRKQGRLIIVLNHPCFRIPRQSSWKIDEANKIQYRRIDRYLSPMKIPIVTHPGKAEQSTSTFSFHHPLSDYVHWLKEAGFVIENIDEWCSDKVSTGKNAKYENRAREEIPLFMAITAKVE